MTPTEAREYLLKISYDNKRAVFPSHGDTWKKEDCNDLKEWHRKRNWMAGKGVNEFEALASRLGRMRIACLEMLRKQGYEVSERRWDKARMADAHQVQAHLYPQQCTAPAGRKSITSPYTRQNHTVYDLPPEETVTWIDHGTALPTTGYVRLLLADGTVSEPTHAAYVTWTELIVGFSVVPSKQKGTNTMDLNVATFVSEGARTVNVQFLNNPAKTYTYVTDLDLVEDDLVVVPANGAFSVAQVVTVDDDLQIEPNSDKKYLWVAAKVDMTYHNTNQERLNKIEDKLNSAYKKNIKRSFAAQVLAGLDETERGEILALTNSKV